LCQKLESIGCSYLTVHARTKYERHEPIHLDELKLVADCSHKMPIVANGDLFSLDDCKAICKQAKLRGVMCARGLLENPALFAGYTNTPIDCIREWLQISLKDGTNFSYFHSVLCQMLQNVLSKTERRYFNTLATTSSVVDYLNENILFTL
jgi:tRNA-dihydrouridine synthase 4